MSGDTGLLTDSGDRLFLVLIMRVCVCVKRCVCVCVCVLSQLAPLNPITNPELELAIVMLIVPFFINVSPRIHGCVLATSHCSISHTSGTKVGGCVIGVLVLLLCVGFHLTVHVIVYVWGGNAIKMIHLSLE